MLPTCPVTAFDRGALLMEGCARNDFHNGDAGALYRSVHSKLFTLPDDTLVYPAHDYKECFVPSIAQEIRRNPRLENGTALENLSRSWSI